MRLPFALLLAATLAAAPTAAFAAFNVVNNGFTSYTIDGNTNPTLNLTRGQTYTFNVAATGHPFWIKTVQSTGTTNAYGTGVTNNGIDSGTITFTVANDAPATLFYDCQFHAGMTGQIHVSSAVPGLNEWTGAALVLLLAAAGAWVSRRRAAA